MKKSIITTIIVIILFLLSIGCGYFGIKNSKKNMKMQEYSKQVEEKENENTIIKTVEASTSKVKIIPNTKLVIKKYYSKCNHSINAYVELPKEFINLGEEEFKEKYSEWKVQKFTTEEVILLKEIDGFCNEHYVLRDKDGMIAVFKINENGDEILSKISNISTEYLTQNDLLNIKNGIKIYGTEELNKTLEDYE